MKNWNQISKREKLEIFSKIAAEKGISTYTVEKDWWITEAVYLIFQTRLSTHLILKGGPAFNKAWNLIEKFSNDIDLSLDISFYGFKGAITSRELATIQKRLYNYISQQFYPSLEQKFKDKELNVVITLRENDSAENVFILEINYDSIVKYKSKTKSKITLKIDFKSHLETCKMKSFSSFVSSHYPDKIFPGIPVKIPCVNPESVFLLKDFLK
ncbi:nucleotidyl transferase AbiEii/AbiGii toxin family protein [Flavobacterium sp. FlaQc-57]|uniref:nucleotidyl transferase AbiEii/AbiGii toxin family protein n=1 Tax=Flavobacterium sp. FlaQc-57 TaxID=3374186 RepID=UPI0037566BD7